MGYYISTIDEFNGFPVYFGTMHTQEAKQTLQLAQQLDPDALALIHDEYYPVVFRYVRYHLDDEPACEDIAGEVFLRLLTALFEGKGPTVNLRAWLLGTASHLVNDHLRLRYNRPTTPIDILDYPTYPSAEEHASLRWERQLVRAALRELTQDQQNVLAFRFGEEYSLEETAHLMGKTIGAIKTLQFRALAALRRLLGEKQKV